MKFRFLYKKMMSCGLNLSVERFVLRELKVFEKGLLINKVCFFILVSQSLNSIVTTKNSLLNL